MNAMRIIVPVILTLALFVITINSVLIPMARKQLMERKRETIRELVNSVWTILAEYDSLAQEGKMPLEEARAEAVTLIREMRYGPEGKDYFWINDMRPFMVMHPYRPDLDGKDISDYQDPDGKRLFVEFVKVVKENGAGYVDYRWQWKDDSSRIVPKISYVRGFEPWGWIVGTGIYVEDVRREITTVTATMNRVSTGIFAIASLLALIAIWQGIVVEEKRSRTEAELRESQDLYSTLVENVSDMVFLLDEVGNVIFTNSFVEHHYAVTLDEIRGTPLCFFWCGESINKVDKAVRDVIAHGEDGSLECVCENNHYDLSIAPLKVGDTLTGMICVARDITKLKKTEQVLRDSWQQLRALSRRVLSLQEAERAAVSRELHDELGQQLTALRWSADRLGRMLDEEKESRIFAGMIEILETSMDSLRNICGGLRPRFLDDLGLMPAIEALIEGVKERTEINCDFECGVPEEYDISEETAIVIYRVFQESLNNIIKHSGARNVKVCCRIDGSRLVLEITDDGKGIAEDPDKSTGGLGIVGMKERAALCSGNLRIESVHGKGTTVKLTIPTD